MLSQICEASVRQQDAEETTEAVGPDVDNFPKTMVIDARGDLPMRIGQHFHSVVKSKKGFPVFLNSNELVVTVLQRILGKVDVLVSPPFANFLDKILEGFVARQILPGNQRMVTKVYYTIICEK